jgi:hypothetical protein
MCSKFEAPLPPHIAMMQRELRHADGSASRRKGRSVARVGDKFFGDSVLEGGPKQRQNATIGMIGLAL